MNTTLELNTMLTMSTAHITVDTIKLLDEEPDTNRMCLSVYPKGEVGWYIYLCGLQEVMQLDNSSEDMPKGYGFTGYKNIPDDLTKCLIFAIQAGADVLCFDEDAIPYPYMQQYDD